MEGSTETTVKVQIPDFEADLPSYFPVHSSLRMNMDSAQLLPIKGIDEQLSAVRKSVERFLSYAMNSPHLLHDDLATEFLDRQRENYAGLLQSKYKLQLVQETLKQANREIVDTRRGEENLSLGNLAYYRGVTKPNFADSIASKLDANTQSEKAIENAMSADPVYQFLKHARFVVENPEEPLPDESKDDELAVSGGKVSLKDPLSMDYFSEPVISIRCQHVFEKKYIAQQLQQRPRVNCPITGCKAEITSKDLKDDKLMELRIKVFQATEKKRDQITRI